MQNSRQNAIPRKSDQISRVTPCFTPSATGFPAAASAMRSEEIFKKQDNIGKQFFGMNALLPVPTALGKVILTCPTSEPYFPFWDSLIATMRSVKKRRRALAMRAPPPSPPITLPLRTTRHFLRNKKARK